MKKSLIALAVLGSFVGAASAQSSVTLFGIVDVNAKSVKNGSNTVKQLGTDGISSSRLGVRGVEDLGGGLKAGFWLESAVNPDVGTANTARFWHRRASVSLMGSFGEVRAGRFLTEGFTGWADYDTFGTNGVGSLLNVHSSLSSGATTAVRADNMVSYFLPGNLGGFYGSATAAAGENVNGNKYLGVRLGYAQGPVNVSGSMASTDTNGNKFKVTSFGGSYDLGVAKLNAAYTQNKYMARKQTVMSLGASVPVGSGSFRASFASANANAAAEAVTGDATLFAIGYVHDLSKRTALYGSYASVNNKSGKATFSVSTPPAAPTGLADSSGLEVGVRHSF
jgi:predicted porin